MENVEIVFSQIFQHKNFQVELINKQHDQMYALLAIALTLHPTRIDESVHSQLKVKRNFR